MSPHGAQELLHWAMEQGKVRVAACSGDNKALEYVPAHIPMPQPGDLMERLSSRAQASLSAALRHVRDAEHLAAQAHSHTSLDQAFHLAGFGPECVRKALLSDGALDKAIGHGVGEAAEQALAAALAWDLVAHRYAPRNWAARFQALDDWTVDARYRRTGHYKIEVITAGNLDERYFEKLSRLDFIGGGLLDVKGQSPVERGLRHLLNSLRSREPHFILLDSRAGLHDIAGLSLHGLAHVDVLVSRASEQGYRGLELTLQALGRRRKPEDMRCVVVHSLAPPDPASREAEIEEQEFRKRSYDALSRSLYASLSDLPQFEDDEEPHWPRVIRRHPLLERLTRLPAARDALFGQGYRELLERIVELCEPETPSTMAEEGERA